MRTTLERIGDYLSEAKGLAPEELPPADASLLQAGLLDSLGMIDLVAFLEESFKIEVDDEDLVPENFETLSAMAGFVERKATAV